MLPVAALLLLSQWLAAGVIPGRWEKVDALPPGNEVYVSLQDGSRVRGRLLARSAQEIALDTQDGEARVPLEAVSRVAVAVERPDRLVNGTLLGLAAGLAFGGVLAATDGSAEVRSAPGEGGSSIRIRSGDSEFNNAALIGGSAAAGAVLGLLIDASHDNRKTRYETVYVGDRPANQKVLP